MKNLESMGLRYQKNALEILDQTRLPNEEVWIEIRSTEEMTREIQRLAVRGAPLIGVAAALSLAQEAQLEGFNPDRLKINARALREARPTAVNLMHAIDRMLNVLNSSTSTLETFIQQAIEIFEEDARLCRQIGEAGAAHIRDGETVLTHCNAGALATAGIGTALGAIRVAHEQGKKLHVFVDETRPLLQGARLTAWELQKLGIPHTLICDNMAGALMSQSRIHRIFVGADRIAANGDFANKIGTYSLAVLAKYHHVPFYVLAPTTTFDRNTPSGREIQIEQRSASEVRRDWASVGVPVWNPAFDVSPRALATEIISENGAEFLT